MRYSVWFSWVRARVVSLSVAVLLLPIQTPLDEETRVSAAMTKLWAADAAEREAGKRTLLLSAENAIPPLLSLLDEIIANPRKRFLAGKEAEGLRASDRLDRALKDGNEAERFEAWTEFRRLEISNRLKSDAIDLLVALKAEMAVSRLISLLVPPWEIQVRTLGKAILPPAAQALRRIGSIATPELLQAILDPDPFIRAWEPHISASGGTVPNYEYLRPLLMKRAILIVGQIGDAQAIPVLETLLNSSDYHSLAQEIAQAIGSIRSRR